MNTDHFPVHTLETAPAGSQATMRHVAETLGRVPNLAAAMAESPTLLQAFFQVRDLYARGTLSPVEIQVLSLTNAFENGCEWCMAFHSAAALKEGLAPADLALLRDGSAPAVPRLRALSDYARTMMSNRGGVSEADLAAFLDAGYTRAQALEVVLGAAFSVMANFAGHLVHAPLDAMLERLAWRAPAERGRREAATTRDVAT